MQNQYPDIYKKVQLFYKSKRRALFFLYDLHEYVSKFWKILTTVLHTGLTTSVEGGVPSFGLCSGIRFVTTRVASIGKSFEIDQLTPHCCGSFPYGHDDQRFRLSLVKNARALQ